MRIVRHSFVLLPVAALAACDNNEPTPTPDGARASINVAPLTLDAIDDVCYGIVITNGDPALLADTNPSNDPHTVVSLTGICSGDYGNAGGGDISYVASCDASVSPAHNYVALTLESVTAGGVELDDQTVAGAASADYQNPCPAGHPCVLDFECIENGDVPVEFDLTIVRRAEQGFFDIAVNFDDIFCSAKVDTCYPNEAGPDRPIELLFGRPTAGATELERGHTAVLGLACTAGPNASKKTHLYLDDVTVTCRGVPPIVLNPALGPGNVYDTPGVFGSGIWQYAVYEGREALDCGNVSCDKAYWNMAFGVEGLPPGCYLQTTATATDHALVDGKLPANINYPVITVEVPLTGGTPGIICDQHGLDTDSGVATIYKDFGVIRDFGFELTQTETGVDTHAIVVTPPPDLGGNDGYPAVGGEIPKGPPGLTVTERVGPQDRYDYWRFLKGSGSGFVARCTGGANIRWRLNMAGAEDGTTMSGFCDGNQVFSGEAIPDGFYYLEIIGNSLTTMTDYSFNLLNTH